MAKRIFFSSKKTIIIKIKPFKEKYKKCFFDLIINLFCMVIISFFFHPDMFVLFIDSFD